MHIVIRTSRFGKHLFSLIKKLLGRLSLISLTETPENTYIFRAVKNREASFFMDKLLDYKAGFSIILRV
jgi:hypothetical protein